MARPKGKKKTRAANGEGSLKFNFTTNKWELTFSYKDEFGHPKRKWVNGDSPEECEYKKEEFLRRNGLSKDIKSYTIPDILGIFCRNKLEYKEITEATALREMYTINIIEKSDLGKIPVVDVKAEDINCFFKKLVNSEYADSTNEKVWVAIKKALNEAMRREFINENPMESINIKRMDFKKKKREVKAFTIEDEKRFLSALEDYTPKGGNRNYYKQQFLIELLSGCRMGEINALTIDDVNFETGNLEIWRTVTKDLRTKPILGEKTKTPEGTRYVPMCDELVRVMKEVVKNYTPNEERLLFPNKNGKNLCLSTAQANSAFLRICKKAGLLEKEKMQHEKQTYGQHMLRHTFATRCVENGVDIVTLSKILGHTDINTTMIYIDVFGEKKKRELEKFNTAMRILKEDVEND